MTELYSGLRRLALVSGLLWAVQVRQSQPTGGFVHGVVS